MDTGEEMRSDDKRPWERGRYEEKCRGCRDKDIILRIAFQDLERYVRQKRSRCWKKPLWKIIDVIAVGISAGRVASLEDVRGILSHIETYGLRSEQIVRLIRQGQWPPSAEEVANIKKEYEAR